LHFGQGIERARFGALTRVLSVGHGFFVAFYLGGEIMATVVVMDDDDFVRKFVCRLLQISGHQVLAFPDAAPALNEVDFNHVDLVITDLQMPTPGVVAIKTIRERGFDVPIVVISGHIQPSEADEYIALGAQSLLTKPFAIANFWKICEPWIGKMNSQMAG
jgi:CheY-like chemotaxis protein